MATITANALTLADLAKRQDSAGNIDPDIVEILNTSNEVVEDALWVECNDGSNHKTTVRSGLPSGTWRLLNYGVQPEKSTTVQVKDACGMLETYSKVDAQLVKMAKDKAAFRMSEDKPFIEGMTQNFINTLFYGSTAANPERFTGLAPRFAAKFGTDAGENAENILLGGATAGTSNSTSIYLVNWASDAVHCIYPEGSVAGLQVRDLGEDTLSDGNGGEYQGFRTHYKWDCGLTVRDWRKVVRIANIDTAALTKNASSGADLIDLMVRAIETLPTGTTGKLAFYCNRTVRSFLRRQIANKANVWLNMEEVAGKKALTFDGIPVRRVDQLTNTETAMATS